ncbi:hypothetical protein JW711_03075 [Candidatus Woesearchaeota archaeon]|nr:hypothetical protein [Candidatus Woesearchaeota archaeon]
MSITTTPISRIIIPSKREISTILANMGLKEDSPTAEMLPTHKELQHWLVHTVQHSCHFEKFRYAFYTQYKFDMYDSETPHDLVKPGNKLEWDVMRGLALQYRKPFVSQADYHTINEDYVFPARELHRQQRHHEMWNGNKPNPKATHEDMLIGAIDAICSQRETRDYQGGFHTYDQVWALADKNPPHKSFWMHLAIDDMETLDKRDEVEDQISQITNLHRIPNIGLPSKVYDAICQRVNETLTMLETEHDYRI